MRDPLDVWIIIAMLALIVGALRCVFLVMPRDWRPRGKLEDALRHAPLAALAALVAPQVLAPLLAPAPDASLAVMLLDPRLVSAAAVVLVARWRANVFLAVLAGVATYLWMLR